MPFKHPENDGEFRQAVVDASAAGKKAFVQVSATWCGPCSGIKDDMAALAEEMAAKYDFVYVDVDKCESIQEVFEVTSMPTFLVFEGMGAPKARYAGARMENIRSFATENQ